MKRLTFCFFSLIIAMFSTAQNDSASYWQTLITDTNADFHSVVNLQDKYFTNHPDTAAEESGNNNQYIRFKNYWQNRVGNSGSGPANVFNALKNYKKVYDNLDQYYSESNNPSEDWSYLGPKGLKRQNYGIVICVKADVSDPTLKTLYAGSGASGLWKTIDGGKTWKNITGYYLPAGLGIYDIAISPQDHNVIYIATGVINGVLRVDYFGKGILYTTNGGISWAVANLNPPVNFWDYKPTTKLLMDQSNPAHILAFGKNYIYRTLDGINWTEVPNLDPNTFCNSSAAPSVTPKVVRDAEFEPNDLN